MVAAAAAARSARALRGTLWSDSLLLWRSGGDKSCRSLCSGAAAKPPTSATATATATSATEEAETVDVQQPERTKIMVLGGNGFVGSHVCKEAVVRGIPVVSLNRSGKPHFDEPWVNKVEWIRGNLFEPNSFGDSLQDVSAVISCVGGFGSNETMRKVNGDANVKAVNAAADAGVKRFVYVSASDLGFASYILRGYFEGKKAAENAVQSRFPYGGVILRPGFIHGTRRIGSIQLPLGVIGTPLEMAFRNLKSVSKVPVVGHLVVPPLKATSVAKASIRSAVDNAVPPGVLDVWGIMRLGDHY